MTQLNTEIRSKEILNKVFEKMNYMIQKERDKDKSTFSERELHVLLLSNDPASLKYVGHKATVARDFMVKFWCHTPSNREELFDVMDKITKNINARIIIQYPFDYKAYGFESYEEVFNLIPKKADIDGFLWNMMDANSVRTIDDLVYNPNYSPTAKFAIMLLDEIQKSKGMTIEGSPVTVIGQGLTSGLPLAIGLERIGATVSWINSRTSDIHKKSILHPSKTIISCAGVPHLVNITDGMYGISRDCSYINIGMGVDELGKIKPDINVTQMEYYDTYFANKLFGTTGKGTCLALLLNTLL